MDPNPYESPFELNEPLQVTIPPRPIWLDMFYLTLMAFIIVILIFATVVGIAITVCQLEPPV